MDLDFLRNASETFRDWQSGKKSLRDMTDPELVSFEEYLRLYLMLLPAGGSAPPAVPSRPKLLKKVLLSAPIFVMLFFLVYSMIRGL